MKRNSNQKSNQVAKDKELNTCNEFDEDNKLNDEIKTNKNNSENDVTFINTELDSCRNEFQHLKTFVQDLRFNDDEIKNEVHSLRNDVHELTNDVHELSSGVHELRNMFSVLISNLFSNENLINNEEQNNNINYDELLEEKELDEKSFEKYKEEKCAICLEDFNIGNKVCYLPCLHIYHSFCIKNWLKIRGKCPLCGNDLIQNNS